MAPRSRASVKISHVSDALVSFKSQETYHRHLLACGCFGSRIGGLTHGNPRRRGRDVVSGAVFRKMNECALPKEKKGGR